MPAIKWHGGKNYLADWIISQMQPHTHYVEPYFGGGAVLFRKPVGASEVINDVNQELMSFWRAVRDDFESLERRAACTPVSEPDWYPEGPLGFLIRFRQSYNGGGKSFAPLSRNRTRRNVNEQAAGWFAGIEGLYDAWQRLRGVVIFCKDAVDVIKQQDGGKTLFYLDPPYWGDEVSVKNAYDCNMTEDEHWHLLETLAEIKGRFLLSGYHSEMYDDAATQAGWTCHERHIDNKTSSWRTLKTECLWTCTP